MGEGVIAQVIERVSESEPGHGHGHGLHLVLINGAEHVEALVQFPDDGGPRTWVIDDREAAERQHDETLPSGPVGMQDFVSCGGGDVAVRDARHFVG